ncbi:hypothetical protein Daesc_000426 [Daldinia eschscholtzii]|uniref:Steroid 5-alpha reductase C-terminal domain-containing protein n=1 Tax=Daldinia eschscholtzii TaxID=292717 RepID=A0AAX6MYE5_9PEZI
MPDRTSDRKPPAGGAKKFDLIHRGDRSPTPWGTLTFVGLRLADIPLQHALLSPAAGLGTSLLSRVGVATVTPAAVLSTGIPFVDSLGTPTNALLLLFACGSAAKQIYWQTVLSYESFPASAALAVALTLVGTAMFLFGISLETLSEAQRKAFKDSPENKGKVCKVGVWRWARHINYFGYSLWRGGYTMVATGWIGGLAFAAAQMWDLSHRAAAVLDEYCTDKYKEQWAQFKREVPYKIFPGVY